MQASDLVELGAVIAIHAERFVAGHGRLSRSAVAEYWSASRCRFDRWYAQLARFQTAAPLAAESWPRAAGVVQEILASEILTRVWTAIGCETDRRQGLSFVSPVLRSTLLAHLSARNRALNTIAEAFEQQPEQALEINRLRSRSERWTDLLLAHLLPECAVADFAFDVRRVADFAEDLPVQAAGGGAAKPWELLQAAARSAFDGRVEKGAASRELNRRIACSIAAGFPAEQFDSTGRFRNLWLRRLDFALTDLGTQVAELLAGDRRGEPLQAMAGRAAAAWR